MAATPQTRLAATGTGKTRAKSIGHYILGKTIGEGTFGKVKLGTHILTGERVAVKVLEKDRIVEVADVERVAREVHILKLIRHPHIVQLYEIIETRRQLYLIMEYASGGELFDYIVASGRVPELEACRFFQQIIAGVEKIHMMNIVHRDLKPENLLLDEHKSIKIVDFGLSNVYRDGQLLKTACGSPCYAAPEMIAGHHYVPSLCDLWSCGVILFALVCGYLPFEDQNTAQLYKKILAADFRTPTFLSEAVKGLIAGLLTTDPGQRFTIPTIRAHPWYRQVPESSIAAQCCQHSLQGDVLKELDNFGFPRDYAVRCLELNKHNHVTTTYYLLAEKTRRFLDKLEQGTDVLHAFDIPDSALPPGNSDCQDLILEDLALPGLRTSVNGDPGAPSQEDVRGFQGQAVLDATAAADGRPPLESPGTDRPVVSPRNLAALAAPVSSNMRSPAPGASAVDMARVVPGASPRSPGYPQASTPMPWSPHDSARPRPQDSQSPASMQTPQVQKAVDTPRRRSPEISAGPTAASTSIGGGPASTGAPTPAVTASAAAQQVAHEQAHGSAVVPLSPAEQPLAAAAASEVPPVTPRQPAAQAMNSTAAQYARSAAAAPATPASLVHRIFGKDSPPSAPAATSTGTGAPAGVAATIAAMAAGSGPGSPQTNAARRSPAASGPGASAGLATRASVGSSATYNPRATAATRDLTRSTESARRRAGIPEAPQSARARLGGRPPVPTTGSTAPAATTPRAGPSGSLSARGERLANRAMSASPAAVSTRESLGRSLNATAGSSRATWNAWSTAGSNRTTRVAMR